MASGLWIQFYLERYLNSNTPSWMKSWSSKSIRDSKSQPRRTPRHILQHSERRPFNLDVRKLLSAPYMCEENTNKSVNFIEGELKKKQKKGRKD